MYFRIVISKCFLLFLLFQSLKSTSQIVEINVSSLSPPFVSGLGSCEGVPLGTVGNSGKPKLLSIGRLFAGFEFCVPFEEALIEAAGGAEAAGSIPEYGGGPSLAGLTGVFSSMLSCWLFIAGGFGKGGPAAAPCGGYPG